MIQKLGQTQEVAGGTHFESRTEKKWVAMEEIRSTARTAGAPEKMLKLQSGAHAYLSTSAQRSKAI